MKCRDRDCPYIEPFPLCFLYYLRLHKERCFKIAHIVKTGKALPVSKLVFQVKPKSYEDSWLIMNFYGIVLTNNFFMIVTVPGNNSLLHVPYTCGIKTKAPKRNCIFSWQQWLIIGTTVD